MGGSGRVGQRLLGSGCRRIIFRDFGFERRLMSFFLFCCWGRACGEVYGMSGIVELRDS